MTSVVTFSTVVFVVATYVRAQRAPLPHQSNFIPKAVAHRGHDQKELGGRGDADARRHQLRAEPTAAWRVWARHGHAAHSDKEALRVRTRLLQDKLRLAAKRVKREVKVPGQKPEYVWVAPRAKKGAEDKWEPDRKGPPSMELHFYNPDIFFPENIAALENETGPYQEILRKERKKRPKREAAVFWAGERTGRALELQRVKRTTANPFIPDTNIEDYQIGSADTAEQYVPDTGSAPALTDSFVMSDTSDLDYESEYTISMSDPEDWENYPLTTPSGPNPGWRLSTLADIYQKQKRQRPVMNMEPMNRPRVKRSPKQKKRKIGEYKKKLKARRKRREMSKKRRIIRNSKEDKAVKEFPDEEAIERLLKKPRSKWMRRSNQYQADSKEVLWSNDTHRVVEDKGVTFEWYNKTHYVIFKENATDEWYKQQHVLVYNQDYWENKTRHDQQNEVIKPTSEAKHDEHIESDDYNEEFTEEELGEKGAAHNLVKSDNAKDKEKTKHKTTYDSGKAKTLEITDSTIRFDDESGSSDKDTKESSSLGWEDQINDANVESSKEKESPEKDKTKKKKTDLKGKAKEKIKKKTTKKKKEISDTTEGASTIDVKEFKEKTKAKIKRKPATKKKPALSSVDDQNSGEGLDKKQPNNLEIGNESGRTKQTKVPEKSEKEKTKKKPVTKKKISVTSENGDESDASKKTDILEENIEEKTKKPATKKKTTGDRKTSKRKTVAEKDSTVKKKTTRVKKIKVEDSTDKLKDNQESKKPKQTKKTKEKKEEDVSNEAKTINSKPKKTKKESSKKTKKIKT